MRRLLLAAFALAGLCAAASAMSRIKDISEVQGIRENQLVGYGLVMGLAGTGDTMRNSPFTEQSARSMLQRLGVAVPPVRSGRAILLPLLSRQSCLPSCLPENASTSLFLLWAMQRPFVAELWS